MKLSELQSCYSTFVEMEASVQAMLSKRLASDALARCQEMLPLLVPVLKYQKRKGVPLTLPLSPIQVTCAYAPPLFEHNYLTTAREHVLAERALAKAPENYDAMFDEAFAQQELARVLWSYLQKSGECPTADVATELQADPQMLDRIVYRWVEFGIVRRHLDAQRQETIVLQTQLEASSSGMCYQCGLQGKGRKVHFFKPLSCTKCGQTGFFFIHQPTG